MSNNFLFFDGSALLGDVKRLGESDTDFRAARLSVAGLVTWFGHDHLRQFHSGGYRRAVLYFAEKDPRVERMLVLPSATTPGEADDLRIEWCGKRLPEIARANKWLEDHNAPEYVLQCAHRAEKAVDTQICCDALQLAAVGKLDRLFLYTNDSDFVPLVRALRHLGCNTVLIRLTADRVNAELAAECDGFGIVEGWMLRQLFGLADQPAPPQAPTSDG